MHHSGLGRGGCCNVTGLFVLGKTIGEALIASPHNEPPWLGCWELWKLPARPRAGGAGVGQTSAGCCYMCELLHTCAFLFEDTCVHLRVV